MTVRILTSLLLLLLLLLTPAITPVCAEGLTGRIGLRYGEYAAEENGTTVTEGTSFSHQYSLLYEKSGEFFNGRGGEYDMALGYEWTGVEADIRDALYGIDSDVSIKTGKVFYRGEILVAPGGLPFRLNLYSKDMHRTIRKVDNLLRGGADTSNGHERSLLSPNLVDDVVNGQRIETGGTLFVGIRNGHYLGQYRDLLSQLPRLLVDYKEYSVKDLRSETPQHYLDRNLAFVSLNKKDNWFHYRLRQYKDYLDHQQDYEEKIFMLGTVDHQLTRRWINITNWIQISVDGSYTEDKLKNSSRASDELFDLNMFSTYSRSNWKASNFTTYERTTDSLGRLEKRLEVPFFADGEFDRNTAWRFKFIGSEKTLENRLGGFGFQSYDENNVYLRSRVDAMRQSRYTFSPQVELEAKSGDRGEGNAARVGLEFYSNRSYKPKYELFGSYTLAYFNGNSESAVPVDYLENQAIGRVETQLRQSLRVGVQEKLLYGSGDLSQTVTNYIQPQSSMSLTLSGLGEQDRSGDLFRSTTKLYYEHSTSWRLTQGAEFIYDFLSDNGSTGQQFILNHDLRYDGRKLYATMTNKIAWGDDIESGDISSQLLGVSDSREQADFIFNHKSRLHYSPNRSWESEALLTYDLWHKVSGDTEDRVLGEQKCKYNIYKVNGMVRKLAELYETAEFERYQALDGTQSVLGFTLGGNWYPTRHALLGGKIRFRNFEPESDAELSYYLVAGLTYEKLTVSLDYAYGTRESGNTATSMPDRNEHRWSVNVEKIF